MTGVTTAAAAAPTDLPGPLRADWRRLATPTIDPAVFTSALLGGLPAAARRWLEHAIAPGTPLRRAALLHQRGEIKIGRWLRFDADWALAPTEGFIWAATTHLGPLFIRGFDRYTRGSGQMAWRFFGRIPVLSAAGPDIDRSALGRLVSEMCFVPAAALSPLVRWEHLDERRAVARVDAGGRTHRVTLTVAESGRLDRVELQRWGKPDGQPFREHTFTALMDGPEGTFDGFTIPVAGRAGWWHCPDRCADEEFFRFTIDRVDYR